MKAPFFNSKHFWIPFWISFILLGTFFAWELGYFNGWFFYLPRPTPTTNEKLFSAGLIVLLALNIGLFRWQSKMGKCPVGAKRATGISGALGALALLCPVCLIIPLSFLGVSISLVFLTPFIPLLQIIALILLGVSTVMMWPKKG